jgi:error-prone DNA polymerase
VHIFGHGNIYIELQRHFDRTMRNPSIIEPSIWRASSSFPSRHQRCASRHARIARDTRRLHLPAPLPDAGDRGTIAHPQCRTSLEIAEGNDGAFRDLPEAIANTSVLSSRLQFTLKDLGYEFPPYPVPAAKP